MYVWGGWKFRLLSPPLHVRPRHTGAAWPLFVQTGLTGTQTDVPSGADKAAAVIQGGDGLSSRTEAPAHLLAPFGFLMESQATHQCTGL